MPTRGFVCIAETLLWVALLIALQLVRVAYQSANDAEAQRGRVSSMILACDRVRAVAETSGWPIGSVMRDLAERIRFSEGLRQNAQLAEEVSAHLNRLEAMAASGGDDSAQKAVTRLAREISILAARRG